MANKELISTLTYPLAPINTHARSTDTEAATSTATATAAAAATELRKKKRRKYIIFASFFISNIVINTVMALTILKARNPRFRLRAATVAAFNAGAPANASVTATLKCRFSIENTNFGRYSYRDATVVFIHRGAPAGEVHVAQAEVGWRSKREFNVVVNLNLGINPLLRGDLNDGVIPIKSEGKLRGMVEIMFMMKKRKGADLGCTMDIVRATQQISNIVCK